VDYRVEPVTAGADAMAEVNVVVQTDGATYRGHGVHTDVVEASAEAFCNALNKVAPRTLSVPPQGGRDPLRSSG
jgi:2-isopropylmalate synthase